MTSEPGTLVPTPFLQVANIVYLDYSDGVLPIPKSVSCRICDKEIYSVAAKDCSVQWLLVPEHFETHAIKIVM